MDRPSIFKLEGDASTATDMSTNAPSILAINGVFCTLTVIVGVLRIYVRSVMLKTFGTDDWFILAATICSVGTFICFIGQTKHGLGMHTASISTDEMIKLKHWQYFLSIIVTVGISFIKISVASFLLRLVPGKVYKIFLYCMIAFLIAFTFSSAGTIAFSCIPIRASWDFAGEPNAKCFSNNTFTAIGLLNSCINIVTDVLFASLPLPMVWTLQVNMRTKLTLIAILSLGYFACAASLTKTVLQTKVFSNPDSTRNDSYFVWNAIELYIGILAASLPALRPLFRKLLDSTLEIRTRAGLTSSGRVGRTGGRQHKYYVQEDGIGMNIGMNSLPGQANKSVNKYDVRITTRSQSGVGHSSEEDLDYATKEDTDSAEDILPMQGRGITKTVNVSVV